MMALKLSQSSDSGAPKQASREALSHAFIWGVRFVRELVMLTAVAVFVSAADRAAATDLGEMHEPMPVGVRLTNWTGLYFGGAVGGVMMSSAVNGVSVNAGGGVLEHAELGNQGAFGGGEVGFDVQFPLSRWVTGVFADFDWFSADAERTVEIVNVANPTAWTPFPSVKTSVNDQWSVGGRLGYLFTPDTLVYGLAAYTSLDSVIDGSYTVPGKGTTSFSDDVNTTGWSLGAGVETRLRDFWSLKFEYRYSSFDGKDSLPIAGRGLHDSLEIQAGRIALIYKFGRW
jgi:outer membrane immunogenic protein